MQKHKTRKDNFVKINTTRFGEIEIVEDRMLTMPAGILGFSGSKRFVIIEKEETQPLCWLQSVDEISLSFVIMNPFLFKADYSLNLAPIFEIMEWDAQEAESVKVYVIINAADPSPDKITANLQAPIIINSKRREAVQMVIYDSPYSHRYPIFGKAGGK